MVCADDTTELYIFKLDNLSQQHFLRLDQPKLIGINMIENIIKMVQLKKISKSRNLYMEKWLPCGEGLMARSDLKNLLH